MRARSFTRPALAASALVLALGLAACGEDDPDDEAGNDSSTPTETADSPTDEESGTTEGAGACTYASDGSGSEVSLPPADPTVEGSVPVTMQTSVGELKLELDADNAPCTVNSFASLAEQGYYDGQSCYRLTTDGIFVLQCGNPTGSPGYTFADELSGTETYPPGTLAMANAGPNTNSSEFFIVYADTPLPPSYTVFGTIDEASLAIVEDVAADGQDNSHPAGGGVPNTAVDIESVTVD
ncbi:peptidylprolyl isomerase [Nocardioides bizhenqiangii]|uniref:Peptidyl-prolyl cis-trans isomerase n=1 Tax=Nocardioides bizhenqiangii TaxID=3095076 RepID=A0ABZ0ZL89_9ACTN|nr:peptidylprolyl isomerase [Nocardioides sp. HM61]WQQ24526.1 peptidylprolyl isomerase [Nocardioides sp. HM61]